MDIPQSISIIGGILAIEAVIFGIYLYFKNPQDALDKREALNQKDTEGTAKVLTQQVEWEKSANAKRFEEIQLLVRDSITMAQNHIHSIDVKVDDLNKVVGGLSNEVTKLSTIISERTPRK